MTDLPRQKHPKLKDFDYSTPGRYFVTLCVKNRGETLSAISEQVVGLFDPKRPQYKDSYAQVVLSDIGEIVEKYILAIDDVYDNVSAERFVIMPNHIHMIIKISSVDGHMGSCDPTTNTKSSFSEPQATKKPRFNEAFFIFNCFAIYNLSILIKLIFV